MNMHAIHLRSMPILLTVTISFGAQAGMLATWKSECVGRSKVSLPSDVEMAAISYDSFTEELAGGSRLSVAQFEDGQRAGWSSISYLSGSVVVSNELEDAQIEDLRSRFSKQPAGERDYLKMLDTPKSRVTIVPDVKSSSPQVMSWSYGSHISYLHQLQNHLLYTVISNDGERLAESNEKFVSLAKNTSYRALFSIPNGSGVCLPFAFIKDKGREPRSIAISYRVRSHPDVMIVVTDESAGKSDDAEARNSPESEINEFWTQYEVSRTVKRVGTRWPLNSKHAVEMDKRKGIASFVSITRKDDSRDFGYLAIVPGDPQSKTDAPQLSLLVVREAKHARAKGIEPIDEKAFLKLAERIAATVQVRRD
ncbi:T6SS immunity protein Tli4 family protein [Pseudoduganella sp. HUAS MS19]